MTSDDRVVALESVAFYITIMGLPLAVPDEENSKSPRCCRAMCLLLCDEFQLWEIRAKQIIPAKLHHYGGTNRHFVLFGSFLSLFLRFLKCPQLSDFAGSSSGDASLAQGNILIVPNGAYL